MKQDWLVVDHFSLDDRWENMLREHTEHIIEIKTDRGL